MNAAREAATLAVGRLCQGLGIKFEPYSIPLLPKMVAAIVDKDKKVADAASIACRDFAEALSVLSVKQVLGALYEGMGVVGGGGRSKIECMILVGILARRAPRTMGPCLSECIPLVMECLNDSNAKVQAGAEDALEATAVQLAEEKRLVAQLTEQQCVLGKELAKQSAKIEQQRGVVERQMTKVLQAREREKEMRKSMVSRESYEGVAAQLEEARALEEALLTAAEQLKWEYEDMEEKLEETQAELARATDARPGRGRRAETQVAENFLNLCADTGVSSRYTSAPARVAETEYAEKRSVRHMAAVLEGRGEGETEDERKSTNTDPSLNANKITTKRTTSETESISSGAKKLASGANHIQIRTL